MPNVETLSHLGKGMLVQKLEALGNQLMHQGRTLKRIAFHFQINLCFKSFESFVSRRHLACFSIIKDKFIKSKIIKTSVFSRGHDLQYVSSFLVGG